MPREGYQAGPSSSQRLNVPHVEIIRRDIIAAYKNMAQLQYAMVRADKENGIAKGVGCLQQHHVR